MLYLCALMLGGGLGREKRSGKEACYAVFFFISFSVMDFIFCFGEFYDRKGVGERLWAGKKWRLKEDVLG